MVTEQNRHSLDSSELNGSRVAPGPLVEGPSISREAFSVAFSRSFDRVYSFVSRRIKDRATCERIVREVLIVNLDLLIEGGDERQGAGRLKALSDQRIKEEVARSLAVHEAER